MITQTPVDFFTTIKTLGIVLKTQELHWPVLSKRIRICLIPKAIFFFQLLAQQLWTCVWGTVHGLQGNSRLEELFHPRLQETQIHQQGATRVHVMKQLLVHMWGDSLFAFDIPGDKQLGGYPTVAWKWEMSFTNRVIPRLMIKSLTMKIFFLRLGADSWTYLDETGKEAMKPFPGAPGVPFHVQQKSWLRWTCMARGA